MDKLFLSDLYQTTYGRMIYNPTVLKLLTEYYVKTSNQKELSYEYTSSRADLVFITGINIFEHDLPIFTIPYVFSNVKGTPVIAIDVRKYTNSKIEPPLLKLDGATRDTGNVEFYALLGCLLGEFITKNFGVFNAINRNMASAFASFISKLLNPILNLNILEKVHLEIAAAHYWYYLFTTEEPSDTLESIIGHVSNTPLSAKLSTKDIKEVIGKLNFEITGVSTMIDNIAAILPEEKRKLLTVDVLINSLQGVWYGGGDKEMAIIGLENPAVFMAMVYSGLTNQLNKKSRLGMILAEYQSKIKKDDIIKFFNNFIEDHKIKI